MGRRSRGRRIASAAAEAGRSEERERGVLLVKALLWPWTRVPWAKEERDGRSSVWLAKRYNSCEALHCTVLQREGEGEKERGKRLQHGTVVSGLYHVQLEYQAYIIV